MGWYITYVQEEIITRPDMYLENNLLGVNDKIEELEEDVIDCKMKFSMYASSNPNDITPRNWKEDAIGHIQIRMDETLESYEDILVELLQWRRYREYLIEREGKEDEGPIREEEKTKESKFNRVTRWIGNIIERGREREIKRKWKLAGIKTEIA